jgi:hypothetical protein
MAIAAEAPIFTEHSPINGWNSSFYLALGALAHFWLLPRVSILFHGTHRVRHGVFAHAFLLGQPRAEGRGRAAKEALLVPHLDVVTEFGRHSIDLGATRVKCGRGLGGRGHGRRGRNLR